MKYPSFKAIHGHDPIPGKDFDPDHDLCQDDYEYFSGTGRYSDHPDEITIYVATLAGVTRGFWTRQSAQAFRNAHPAYGWVIQEIKLSIPRLRIDVSGGVAYEDKDNILPIQIIDHDNLKEDSGSIREENEGWEGQDRESYTDDQDRDFYIPDEGL